jgi:SAM-dependent methyltransferase
MSQDSVSAQAIETPSRHQDVTALFNEPHWYLNGYAANIRVRSETVQAFSAGRGVNSVLDIGCGDGALSLPFLDNGGNVAFVDISSEMLKIVQGKLQPAQEERARFLVGDILQHSLQPSSFDLVLLVGVLAYWSDPRPLIRRAGSLVRPGGVVIAECTDASHPVAWLNRAYRATTSTFKTHRLTPDTHSATDVTTVFEQEGLRLVRTFRYAYTVPLLSRLASQSTTYRAISRLYGTANSSRRQACGPECLMLFERP